MNRLEGFLSVVDRALSTRKKRHIAGGILTSVSVLFCVLAITVITLDAKEKYTENEQNVE